MDIRLAQILYQVINFAIVLYVLNRFVYKPVMKMLDERASKIKDGLNAAEKNLKIQENLEKKEKLADSQARDDASQIIEDAKKEAKAIIKQAEVDAKEQANKTTKREREAFEAEMESRRKEFRGEAAEIVSEAVKNVLDKSMTVKIQQELIDKQISELSARNLS